MCRCGCLVVDRPLFTWTGIGIPASVLERESMADAALSGSKHALKILWLDHVRNTVAYFFKFPCNPIYGLRFRLNTLFNQGLDPSFLLLYQLSFYAKNLQQLIFQIPSPPLRFNPIPTMSDPTFLDGFTVVLLAIATTAISESICWYTTYRRGLGAHFNQG